MWVQTPWRGYLRSKISFFMYNTIFVYILRVPVSMKGSKGHQKSRKQRKQTGFKELAHICVLCSAIASPSLLSSSPIRVNPRSWAGPARPRGSPWSLLPSCDVPYPHVFPLAGRSRGSEWRNSVVLALLEPSSAPDEPSPSLGFH